MTYEHGLADADAPVTWKIESRDDGIYWCNGEGVSEMFANRPEVADAICRAFHLAKLAGEAREAVDSYGWEAMSEDWLRRYDAAKGGA